MARYTISMGTSRRSTELRLYRLDEEGKKAVEDVGVENVDEGFVLENFDEETYMAVVMNEELFENDDCFELEVRDEDGNVVYHTDDPNSINTYPYYDEEAEEEIEEAPIEFKGVEPGTYIVENINLDDGVELNGEFETDEFDPSKLFFFPSEYIDRLLCEDDVFLSELRYDGQQLYMESEWGEPDDYEVKVLEAHELDQWDANFSENRRRGYGFQGDDDDDDDEDDEEWDDDEEGCDDEEETASQTDDNDDVLPAESNNEVRNTPAEEESQEVMTFIVNGVSFDMVKVEAGTFIMGATPEMERPSEDEKPAHQVTLTKDYYLGKTQVTQALWRAVMGKDPSFYISYNGPVERVSWDDCQVFIARLNAITGKEFRLPTEAEWEFAARGGNKSNHYQYSGSNDLDNVAWYKDNSSKTTHDVATKHPNELGIYDMSGNVYEWCSDWYGEYSSNAQNDPVGPASGSRRVRRGGSWDCGARCCRSSCRFYSYPDFSYYYLGLRLALSE